MKIIRADYLGMCFGVRDAIDLAVERNLKTPLTVFGELVHNTAVLANLRREGIQLQTDPARVPTQDVMITAHGASTRTINELKARGLRVVEATCPLVHHAHKVVQRLVREGCFPIIIGKQGHAEVRGLTEDLAEFAIVLCEEDIDALKERPRFGIAAQTTQPVERVQLLVERIRQRFPASEVRFEDTVCQPTKQRQIAAIELARKCDVVIVVGGAQSNNTRELVGTCSRFCSRVHHVQRAEELRDQWFDDCQVVGITAGTSTLDATIAEVEARVAILTGSAGSGIRAEQQAQEAHSVIRNVPVSEPAFAG